MTADAYGISFWGDEYVPKLDIGDHCTTLEYTKTTEFYTLTAWISWLCELYLDSYYQRKG